MIVFARPLFLFSMAYGVDNAAVVCCFMNSDYCVSFIHSCGLPCLLL